VYAGDSVALTAQASGIDPKTLSWSSDKGRVEQNGTTAVLMTSKRGIGEYAVTVRAMSPTGEAADCEVRVRTELPPAIVVVEKRLSLHSIYFPTAEPTVEHPEGGLLPSQRATLTALAADFVTYSDVVPNAKLVLEGHADPRGSAEYNEHLSERRVQASKQFLVAQGVPEGSVEIKALGERHNLTDSEVAEAVDNNDELTASERASLHKNMTAIVLASNRRVDITLSPAGQHSARKFPFNAKDSMTLIREAKPKGDPKHARHGAVKR
jgi:outer membrane protein OmpA-like peptidoglycan-associated protein